MAERARLGVDIGGTFTDAALESTAGRFTAKVLTTHAAPDDGVVACTERVLAAAGLRASDLDVVIHGTTLATNLLIERKGARTGLLTTAGHRDVLSIGLEHRFDLYDLGITLPDPLVPRALRLPVAERLASDGRVLVPLDEDAVRAAAAVFARERVESIAVCFLHAYADPRHERRAAELLTAALAGVPVSLSSDVAPEMREYERFSTTCANAYVRPVMAGYLERLEDRLRGIGLSAPLLLMLSGGGLTTVGTAARVPVRLVESGPAGGVVFAAAAALEDGLGDIVSFDMGGTTAKLCLVDDGRPQTSRLFEVARTYRYKKGSGLPLRIPVIDMVEIGAGGGSLARADALGRVLVGPESAGSEPGPACYGRGGTRPTVTDADIVLGRIDPETFAGGRFPLDRAAAEAALTAELAEALGASATEIAASVTEVVEEAMAAAARVHAVESGKRLGDRVLVAFGGAAPLHVAAVARRLGMTRFLVPDAAGVGSAVGFLRAPVSYEIARSHRMKLADLDPAELLVVLDDLAREARAIVLPAAQGLALGETRTATMRYAGQGHEIVVVLPDFAGAEAQERIETAFAARYRAVYGRLVQNGDPEILTLAVLVAAPSPPPPSGTARPATNGSPPVPRAERVLFDPVRFTEALAPTYERAALPVGTIIEGPASIEEGETTTILSDGWRLSVLPSGSLLCEARESDNA